MEFSPFNPVVKFCLQGMEMEDQGHTTEALNLYMQGWREATQDFEKFLAAHYIARCQQTVADKLEWLEKALHFALRMEPDSVQSAMPALYHRLGECYDALGNNEKANDCKKLAAANQSNPTDKGPFYHGTRAALQVGDLLMPGGNSNYQSDLVMNHIYFTAMVNGAGLAAALAKGEAQERVYEVVPTGGFENDPNVTDKKFPGNPTRSYRSLAPLKIVGELKEWVKQPPEVIQKFKERLAQQQGEIIN